MKNLLLLSILLYCSHLSRAQNITLQIVSPTPNQVVPDTILNISVRATSSVYELSSVTATVNSRHLALVYNIETALFEGKLSLIGLPQTAPLSLQVLAIDGANNQKTATTTFVYAYDPAPQLVIDSTMNASNANPLLHVKARCIDNGVCKLNITASYAYSSRIYYSQDFVDSVNTFIDLSRGDGQPARLVFTATDSLGQQATKNIHVFVESSPYLKKVFTADNDIIDFNFDKVLTVTDSIGKIIDINSGTATLIPGHTVPEDFEFPGNYPSLLTKPGAIVFKDGNHLAEWSDHSLYDLGEINSTLSLLVTGDYASWSNGTALYLRDLRSKSTKQIGSANNWRNQLLPGGVMVYQGTDYNVYKYEFDSSRKITTNDGNQWNVTPLTDGSSILYVKQPPCCEPQYALFLNNGTTETLLSDYGTLSPNPGSSYQINNKWIAYTKKGLTGVLQAWLRDSSGKATQKSFFNTNSDIDLLDNKGNFTFLGGATTSRYFVNGGNGQAIKIGSQQGKTYYRNSNWYLTLGSGLYRVDLNISSDSLKNSQLTIYKDSAYAFKLSNFTDNFSGPGNLMAIKITGLSQKGILKLNNAAITVNQEIARADIPNLVYTPNSAFVGTDSLQWTGSNGAVYAPGTAKIGLLIVQPYFSVADGNWDDPAIWANHQVPPPGADIIIKTKVTCNVNVTCNSLQVLPPGSLVVNTGKTITILH